MVVDEEEEEDDDDDVTTTTVLEVVVVEEVHFPAPLPSDQCTGPHTRHQPVCSC